MLSCIIIATSILCRKNCNKAPLYSTYNINSSYSKLTYITFRIFSKREYTSFYGDLIGPMIDREKY